MLNTRPKISRRRSRYTQAVVALSAVFVLAFGALAPNAMTVTDPEAPADDQVAALAETHEVEPVDTLADEPLDTVESGDVDVEPAPPVDATEPAEDIAEPVEPVIEPADPVIEPAEPATEPAEPAAEASTPAESVTDDEAVASEFETFAVGADGGTPPYVYWDVRDVETGELVPGATFEFEHRRLFLRWRTGDNADSISDCDGTCSTSTSGNVLDRDADGGEFLLEHRATSRNNNNRVTDGDNYRVSQNSAPQGYEWVVSGDNTQTIGNQNSNAATWNNGNGSRTHNFGTFQVRKIPTAPQCTAGFVYGLSGTGQLQQVDSSGTVTNIGTRATEVSNFNGLGIGSGGEVYAIERSSSSGTSQNGTVYRYDTTTGVWTSTGANSGNTGTNLVAGAVDLSSGLYYFGGFTSNGNFRVYEYNPSATPNIRLKGTVVTDATSSSNGDMAFDSAGNLYIVRGEGSTTTVFSVTKAAFHAATGGNIPSAQAASVQTMNNVNGVAFDASGKAYLGSGSEIRSYDMPDWTGMTVVTSSGLSSTDLATCSSPPTIVIEKEIIGGRVNSGDQFKLTLNQGNTLIDDATTIGSATGIQSERIGPLPTVRNVALNFAEVGAGTTNLANYASAYQCTVTHLNGTVENLQQVNGTQGSITIPTSGEAVRCVFRNSPLVANVVINKHVTDVLGANPVPDEGWTVSAETQATSGTATQTPSATTQVTDTAGRAEWDVKFGAYDHHATVTVYEDSASKTGYEFMGGQCVITGLDGSERVAQLEEPTATPLTDVKPGDSVECTYVNKPSPGTLAITKAFDESVPTGSGTDVHFSGAYTCELDDETVASGAWIVTGAGDATLTPSAGTPAVNQIPAGATCSVTEDQPTGSEGLPNSSYEWGAPTVSDPVGIVANETSTVTVTNTAERAYGNFSVTKIVPEGSVVDPDTTFGGAYTCELDGETVTGTWGSISPGATWSSTLTDEIPLGATCVVTEERSDEPVSDGSYVWDGDPEITPSAGVEATNEDQLNLITVTNKTKPVLGTVIWAKVDGQDNLLNGSEWTITGPGFDDELIVDCTETPCEGLDKDPIAGQFLLDELEWGDYTLTETKAPAGYYPIGAPIEFTIGANGDVQLNVNLGNIKNEQIDGPSLPLTGGLGRDFFVITGLGILGLGLGAVGITHIRNRREAA